MVPTKERFIVAPNVLIGNEQLVVLTDYIYWADYETDLAKWCKDNNSEFSGSVVVLPDEITLTAFLLRWQ